MDLLKIFRGRLNRINFLLATLAILFIQVALKFIPNRAFGPYLALIISLIALMWYTGILVRRFHDFGNAGYLAIVLVTYAVMTLVPGLNQLQSIFLVLSVIILIMQIFLLIKKGDPNTNKYGQVPGAK